MKPRKQPLKRSTSLRRVPLGRSETRPGPVKRRNSTPSLIEGMSEDRCRKIVRTRSAGVCEMCGTKPADTMHHRRKRSQSGPWMPSNILHLCGDGVVGCHGRVSNTRTDFYRRGFLVHSWDLWSEVPVWTWYAGVVLLDDAGGYVVAWGDAA